MLFTCYGCETKTALVRILVIFYSNDMADHRPTLKNNQNTYFLRFGFTPKTGTAFRKTGVLFLLSTYPLWDTLEIFRNILNL